MSDGKVEFDCEGCGVHVLSFGRDRVPVSHLCATCEWLCEFVPDPDEFWAIYTHAPGTWSCPRPSRGVAQ